MKIIRGKVISKKMEKTASVVVERIVVHPLYKKRYRRLKKYHVHDELGTKVGQSVKFTASKPYSKLKKWKIVEIVNEGKKLTKKAGKNLGKKGIERSRKSQKK